jgi:hypothetical protein
MFNQELLKLVVIFFVLVQETLACFKGRKIPKEQKPTEDQEQPIIEIKSASGIVRTLPFLGYGQIFAITDHVLQHTFITAGGQVCRKNTASPHWMENASVSLSCCHPAASGLSFLSSEV